MIVNDNKAVYGVKDDYDRVAVGDEEAKTQAKEGQRAQSGS